MTSINDALFRLAKGYNANKNQKRSILEVYPLWLKLCPGNKSVLKWLADNTLQYTDDPKLQLQYLNEFLNVPGLDHNEVLKYKFKRVTLCVQHCMYENSEGYKDMTQTFNTLCEEFLSKDTREFPISYYFVPMIADVELACRVLYKIRPLLKSARSVEWRESSKRKIGIMWLPINSDPSFQCLKLFIRALSEKEDITIFFNEKNALSLMNATDKKLVENVRVRNCSDMDDRATADLIEKDEIDVLFNMYWNFKRGYGIFEEKPARVIINFQGFASPVCAPEVFTHTISDIYMREKIKTDLSKREKLILMPIYHQMNFPASIQPEKMIRMPGEFILGYMPRATKLSPVNVNMILRFLAETQGTRVHLFCNDKNVRAVAENLVTCGLLPKFLDRISVKYEPNRSEYLKRIKEVSLFLDTFGHWSMHSTALEVIWNWVPFVTMKSNTLFSHGEAILQSLDLSELIFDEEDRLIEKLKLWSKVGSRDYVDLCYKLIQNCERTGMFDMDKRVGQFREAITAALGVRTDEDLVIE